MISTSELLSIDGSSANSISDNTRNFIPLLIGRLNPSARNIFLEFFVAGIRNANTRKAYLIACSEFLAWAEIAGVGSVDGIEAIHVATWVELASQKYSPSTVKQRLAAIKMLFDWLVVRQVIRSNPAAAVKGPRLVIRKGRTPVLDPGEARQLIHSIDVRTIIGLRDRALIGTMLYSFARIGAALSMQVRDVYVQQRRLWLRLHEKGGKLHDMPCHHELEQWLDAYMSAARLSEDQEGWLFRAFDRSSGTLGSNRLQQGNAYLMVKRRTLRAGIKTEITNHSFRATGITAYLLNGGTLERAAKMANHASTRTTQLYDRRDDQVVVGEVERIHF